MNTPVETKKPTGSKAYVSAVGRRREAVARVRLYSASSAEVFGQDRKRGDIVVNKKLLAEYFRGPAFESKYKKILEETGTFGKYIISARVVGGGLSGQMDAMVHGIARALDIMDSEKHHKTLSDGGYLTRDPRTRERRKVGNAGKARRKKSSPKR